MPITLPAHAAAILPIHRVAPRALPVCALVTGSCAPDLAYALGFYGAKSHTPLGLLTFCLPAGLLAYAWAELLVLPVLARALPTVRGIQWARFAVTRRLPSSARGWLAAAVAVLLGASTHILWDGFTHRRQWPARELYAGVTLSAGSIEWLLPNFLQMLSSLVGSVIVLVYLARRYRSLPPAEGGTMASFLAVLLPTVAGASLWMAWRLLHPLGSGGHERLWFTFWSSASGGLIGLTLACAVARARWSPRAPRPA